MPTRWAGTGCTTIRSKWSCGEAVGGGLRIRNGRILGKSLMLRVHRSIQQFVDYLDMFSRYKQTENLHAMGAIFDANPQISSVERALLGNTYSTSWRIAHIADVRAGSLCPDTADEAKTLIPSLATKFDDDNLQPILDELQKLRKFEVGRDPDITQADFSARGSVWIDEFFNLCFRQWAAADKKHDAWLRENQIPEDAEAAGGFAQP